MQSYFRDLTTRSTTRTSPISRVVRSIQNAALAGLLSLVSWPAAAELAPAVQADLYLVQTEAYIEDEDYAAAKDAMAKIVALSEEHDFAMPVEFHFKYAQVLEMADAHSESVASVTRYLEMTGQSGEFYRDALELLHRASQALTADDEAYERATQQGTEAAYEAYLKQYENGRHASEARRLQGELAAQRTRKLDEKIERLTEALKKDSVSGRTLLHLAQDPDVIAELIARGADVNARDEYNYTPLHMRVEWDSPQAVSMLIDHGADVSALSGSAEYNFRSPLAMAARGGDSRSLEVAKMLLDHGAEVDGGERGGREIIPLARAASNGRYEMVELLINRGARVNKPDAKGWRAVDFAINSVAYGEGDIRVIQLLSDHGAYPGWTCGDDAKGRNHKRDALCQRFGY